MKMPKSLPMVLLLSGLSQPAQCASVTYETSAKAFDKGAVAKSDGGASPAAQVNHSVSTTFPLRNIGTTQGSATAAVGGRSVGAKVQGEGQLSTQLNTGFGVELRAKSQLMDMFVMDARFPDGTPVPSGFLGFNAVAQGMMDLYGSTTLIEFSSAELHYSLAVGPLGGGSDVIVRFPTSTTSPEVVAVPLSGVVPWVQNQPIQIVMMVDASLDAKLEASGSFWGLVEFRNSLDWLGITNVTDSAGNPVASFSAVSSDTQVDWGRPPAPEVLPPVAIVRKGDSVVLSWPAAAGDVRLESTATLGAEAVWAEVSTPAELVGEARTVTVTIGSTAQFFRLCKP